MEIEILNWAVSVSTHDAEVSKISDTPNLTTLTRSETRLITCDVDGTLKQAALVARDSLNPGDHIIGPALVTEPQTTTFVSADFSVYVDGNENLVLIQDQKGSA